MYQYAHGGDLYSAILETENKHMIDFSANINPLGLPEEVKRAVSASAHEWECYPDPFCRMLTKKTAEFERIEEQYFYFANGASELLFRLALALKPKMALLCAPAFSDYEKALRTVDCRIRYYKLKEEYEFEVQKDYLKEIDGGIDFLILCNPNNPTGQICGKDFLLTVLNRAEETNTTVLIDECFLDFLESSEQHSVKEYLKKYKNLIILKAFTKNFAMPGIRLGYLMTSDFCLLEQMRRCGQDWNVSAVAQTAGISVLSGAEDYLKKTRALIREERQYLVGELESFGFRVYGSKANYIFFKTDDRVDLRQVLLERGILIRSCSNYKNLSNAYYRIAVKKRPENEQLITALKEIRKYI